VVEGEGRHSPEPVSYELVVRSRAKADIRRAAKWYEKQQEGLGEDFVSEVDDAIRRIEANPEQFQVIYRDIRHAITRRFPYGVFIASARPEWSYISSGPTFPGRQIRWSRRTGLTWNWSGRANLPRKSRHFQLTTEVSVGATWKEKSSGPRRVTCNRWNIKAGFLARSQRRRR